MLHQKATKLIRLVSITVFIISGVIFSLMSSRHPLYSNKAIAQGVGFFDIFEEVTEVTLQYGDNTISSLVGFDIDNHRNYIVADLLGKQVVVFNERGKWLKTFFDLSRIVKGTVLESALA